MSTSELEVTASRRVAATPRAVWTVLTSPRTIESWWAPEDLRATVRRFELREGGRVEIHLRYLPALLTSGSAETFRAAGVPIALELRGTVRELVPERVLDLDLRLELDRAAAGVAMRTRFEIDPVDDAAILRVVATGTETPHWKAFGEKNLRGQLERVERALGSAGISNAPGRVDASRT